MLFFSIFVFFFLRCFNWLFFTFLKIKKGLASPPASFKWRPFDFFKWEFFDFYAVNFLVFKWDLGPFLSVSFYFFKWCFLRFFDFFKWRFSFFNFFSPPMPQSVTVHRKTRFFLYVFFLNSLPVRALLPLPKIVFFYHVFNSFPKAFSLHFLKFGYLKGQFGSVPIDRNLLS